MTLQGFLDEGGEQGQEKSLLAGKPDRRERAALWALEGGSSRKQGGRPKAFASTTSPLQDTRGPKIIPLYSLMSSGLGMEMMP